MMDGPLELEEETRKLVSGAISKIDIALSEWDASKNKPSELARKVRELRRFHALLSGWERESLRGGRGRDSAEGRLRKFVAICREMEEAGLA